MGLLQLLTNSARDIPGSWVRAPHRAQNFLCINSLDLLVNVCCQLVMWILTYVAWNSLGQGALTDNFLLFRWVSSFSHKKVASVRLARPLLTKNPRCTRNIQMLIVYGTWYTHPSTNHDRRCLTSVIGREPVLSTWYGRRQFLTNIYMQTIFRKSRKSIIWFAVAAY